MTISCCNYRNFWVIDWCKEKWDMAWENLRCRSSCASVQSDQCLRCSCFFSILTKNAVYTKPNLWAASEAKQTGLSLTWSQTSQTSQDRFSHDVAPLFCTVGVWWLSPILPQNLSCDLTKPTEWLSSWRKLGFLATRWVHSKDSDQTGRTPRLTWVFAGRTITLLVLSCCGSFGICITLIETS